MYNNVQQEAAHSEEEENSADDGYEEQDADETKPQDIPKVKPPIEVQPDAEDTTDPVASIDTIAVPRKKPADVPPIEQRNWLLHLHFVRNELDTCVAIAKEILAETGGEHEFALYVMALIDRRQGRVDESLISLHKCAKLDPKNAEYVKQIGRSLLLLGKHAQSVDVFQQAISIRADDWETHYWQAVAHKYLGDWTAAQQSCVSSLSCENHSRSLRLMAEVTDRSQGYMVAIGCLKKCVDMCPDNADVQCQLGMLYLHTHSYQQAFEALGRSLSVDPCHSGAILAAGSMMQKYGDHDVAISKYRLAATNTPDSAQLWNNIGMCFYGKGKLVAAASCLKRAAYLSPLDWKIQFNLGLVHIALSQYASAFHFTSAAINLQPRVALLYSTLAIILTNLDDDVNARHAHERANTLVSDDPSFPLNFALFELKRGNKDKATVLMEEHLRRMNNTVTHVENDVKEMGERVRLTLNMAPSTLGEPGESASIRGGSGHSGPGDNESLITMNSRYPMPEEKIAEEA